MITAVPHEIPDSPAAGGGGEVALGGGCGGASPFGEGAVEGEVFADQGGEAGLGPGDMFGDDHGHVVGAADGRGAHCVVQADRLTGGQAQLGRRLRRRARRNGQVVVQIDLARLQRLERQVQGHDLGDGGRIASRVGETREQDFTRGGVDHDGRIPTIGRLGFRRRDADRRRQDDAPQDQGGQETSAE